MTTPILECQEITKLYGAAHAVRQLNLSLEGGLIYALLGPSGCGKSTTLRLIAGLLTPSRGKIILRGKVVNGPHCLVPPEQRGIGIVFQTLALWPHMTVQKNLTFGLHYLPRRERINEAMGRLETIGLTHRRKAYPHELSEGERQRVALARALINKPDLLLLDEPLANLDRPLKRAMLDEIVKTRDRERVTVLLVTHDPEEALSVADRLLVMHQGTIVQQGTPQEVYRNPVLPFVVYLLGHGGLLRGEARNGEVTCALGTFSLGNKEYNGEVMLAMRPEDLKISPVGKGIQATVLDGRYEGGRWHVRVDIIGDILPLWTSHPLPAGRSVWLEVINPPSLLREEG